MKLEIDNVKFRLTCDPGEEMIGRTISEALVYRVHDFTSAGPRETELRLLRKTRGAAQWTGPIGLGPPALEIAARYGLRPRIQDARPPWTPGLALRWAPTAARPLRDYQREIVEHPRLLGGDPADPWWGKLVIDMSIRGGKTFTAGEVLRRLGVRSLFIVSSSALLAQAADFLRDGLRLVGPPAQLGGMPLVGTWGDGCRAPGWITVATVQSLLAALGPARDGAHLTVRPPRGAPPATAAGRPRQRWTDAALRQHWAAGGALTSRVGPVRQDCIPAGVGELRTPGGGVIWRAPGVDPEIAGAAAELLRATQAVVWDEAHHLVGPRWREVIEGTPRARVRIGLSGTVSAQEVGRLREDVWVTAATGPIGPRITMSDLAERGWLLRADVRLVEVSHPPMPRAPWADVQRAAIVESAARARAVVAIARHEARRGGRILIHVTLIEHGARLMTALRLAGVRAELVTGETELAARRGAERRLQTGEIDAVIGTVYGEGVDLPWLRVTVNAGGGRDWKGVVQEMRNLTPYIEETGRTPADPLSGPPRWAPVYDLLDRGIEVLERQALARIAEYRRHRAFRVRIVRMGQ